MAKGGGSSGGDANTAVFQEAQRQANLASGTQAINSTFDSQFTPDFYNNLRTKYMQYANPQLDSQYQNAQRQLTYALARTGNLDSSTRADQTAGLNNTYQGGRQQVADTAQQQVVGTKNAVEQAREGLVSQLAASGDATGAAQSAANQAAALSEAPGYSPLANLFGAVTSGLATSAQMAQLRALSGGSAGASPLIFGGTNRAVTVT